MNIEDLQKNKDWKVLDLKMTELGFNLFTNEVMSLNEKEPQVYVHVCVDKVLQNNILRIGSAENGIIKRWIKGTNGHKSTFLWSIGKSEQYKNNASKYPNYLIFFAGLKNLNTKLYILNCSTKESMLNIEKMLTNYFVPIWENKIFKENKKFQTKYIDNLDNISKYGGALDIINTQRVNNNKLLPDVLDFKSNNIW